MLQASSFCHVVHFPNVHLAELVATFLLVRMQLPLKVLFIAALAPCHCVAEAFSC